MPTALPETMRVIEIEKPGGPEVLKLARRPVSAPRGNEVLVRIHATGVNRPDVLQRMGMYPPPPGATDIPGLEAAGEIAAIGEDVSTLSVGDAVCALLPGGGYGEFALVDAGSCLQLPKGLSMEQAATIPETCFTVWANVFDDAGLKAGDTLLVHGGTSGIGVMALALAKAFGATAMATAGTEEKVSACRELGADHAFNYKSDHWDKEIEALGGVDVILDMTGGDFVGRNLACLKPGGRHVSIAFLRGMEAQINILQIMQKRLRLSGSTMKSRQPAEKARLGADIEARVWPLFENGSVKPVIDQVFGLEDVASAHQRMESGAHIGKIVLKVL